LTFLELIERKRDGRPLSEQQLSAAIRDYVHGDIPDYQMAAFLMATFFRGLNPAETRALTMAMRDSGEQLAFPPDPRPLVDKHSTGGIGDKVSLVLAPLLACLGFRVPMISGRGLGITGGTLDKLESIPGFTCALSRERIIEQVQAIGCVICSQTDKMVPADKGLYALRDATGTIASIPLITASILSKKLTEGISSLILDVKFGSGAFMATEEDARKLAHSMVELANSAGVRTRALLTRMDAPTGRSAGNWLEVKETVECLDGDGPEDLRFLTVELAAHLLMMEGKSLDLPQARAQAESCLESKQPRTRFNDMLAAQGADLADFERRLAQDHLAPNVVELRSEHSGWLTRCDARLIGEVVRDLGGGRLRQDTKIDPAVGIDRVRQVGQPVKHGETLCRIHAASESDATAALSRLAPAFEVNAEQPRISPVIHSALV
jgi:pyrimidine-nucleoside phosphorylase